VGNAVKAKKGGDLWVKHRAASRKGGRKGNGTAKLMPWVGSPQKIGNIRPRRNTGGGEGKKEKGGGKGEQYNQLLRSERTKEQKGRLC